VLIAGSAATARNVAPEVELVNITLLGTTASGQRFALTFLVSNPNAEPLTYEGIRYHVRLSGQGYLIGRSDEPFTIGVQARQTVLVELETDGVASISSLMAMVRGPESALAYELAGDLVIGGRPERLEPFAYEGDVPLSMTTRTE
jgi:LEA14-like dessication related protein